MEEKTKEDLIYQTSKILETADNSASPLGGVGTAEFVEKFADLIIDKYSDKALARQAIVDVLDSYEDRIRVHLVSMAEYYVKKTASIVKIIDRLSDHLMNERNIELLESKDTIKAIAHYQQVLDKMLLFMERISGMSKTIYTGIEEGINFDKDDLDKINKALGTSKLPAHKRERVRGYLEFLMSDDTHEHEEDE